MTSCDAKLNPRIIRVSREGGAIRGRHTKKERNITAGGHQEERPAPLSSTCHFNWDGKYYAAADKSDPAWKMWQRQETAINNRCFILFSTPGKHVLLRNDFTLAFSSLLKTQRSFTVISDDESNTRIYKLTGVLNDFIVAFFLVA